MDGVSETSIFRTIHWVPPQLLITEPRWEDIVWDECLRAAHSRGLIPVGPVMVRKATADETREALDKMHPFEKNPVTAYGYILIVAEVMIGVSM